MTRQDAFFRFISAAGLIAFISIAQAQDVPAPDESQLKTPATANVQTQPVAEGTDQAADAAKNDNTPAKDPCPAPTAASATPDDLAKVQEDIDRFTLCVERAQLLERLNESVLKNHLDASRERFQLGDITKTDVSQAESRLAAATAARVAAEGNYRTSRAAFERVTGLSPDSLYKPVLSVAVPGTLDEAFAEAQHANPSLQRARYVSASAAASTRVLKGALLPSVDLSGSLARVYDPSTGDDQAVFLEEHERFSDDGSTHPDGDREFGLSRKHLSEREDVRADPFRKSGVDGNPKWLTDRSGQPLFEELVNGGHAVLLRSWCRPDHDVKLQSCTSSTQEV